MILGSVRSLSIVICLAAGCSAADTASTASAVAITADALPLQNSCNGTDSSHTLPPAVTCQYTVNGSSGTGAAVGFEGPTLKDKTWTVKCYITGIGCSGNGQKKPATCPAPEYPATNQDYPCPPKWRDNAMKSYLGSLTWTGEVLIPPQPSTEKILEACNRNYQEAINTFLNDPAAKANELCNAKAASWTNASKKAPICCIPNPNPMPNPNPNPMPNPPMIPPATTPTSDVQTVGNGSAGDPETCWEECPATEEIEELSPEECTSDCIIE